MDGNEMNENALLLLGEIKGQMRELIHSTNNMSQKFDALSVRVSALEKLENERRGEWNILAMIMKSPLIAWLFAGVAMVWAYIKSVFSS